jgi:hypothetical protein
MSDNCENSIFSKERNRVGSCPHPEKRRFYSKHEANGAAGLNRDERTRDVDGKTMRVYQCGMHFHLTSSPVWIE